MYYLLEILLAQLTVELVKIENTRDKIHKSGCTHAFFTLNESVKYFTKKGSGVYCAFLDASKAFDKVLHNGIFLKLPKRCSHDFLRLLNSNIDK